MYTMNRKNAYKDMDKYRETVQKQKLRYYRQTQTGCRMPGWSYYEDRVVIAHEIPDREISLILGRSVSAIQHRRCLLKKQNQSSES